MSILDEQRALIRLLDQAIDLPRVRQVLLPPLSPSDDMKDNFAFLILEDGSAGAFYTSLQETRGWVESQHAALSGKSVAELALRMDGFDIPRSALALGAFNAISQHIMRRAGFDPALSQQRADTDLTAHHIGMVGFFGPLAERYLAQNKRVTVIELNPNRIPDDLPLEIHASPSALQACDYVLCTASTLINNTLESIIQAVQDPAAINLIGPSASGLPDVLFKYGIGSAGGFVVDDLDRLESSIIQGESWGKSGRKYQLNSQSYPGIESLLDRVGA